jgi:hypothetical protein
MGNFWRGIFGEFDRYIERRGQQVQQRTGLGDPTKATRAGRVPGQDYACASYLAGKYRHLDHSAVAKFS